MREAKNPTCFSRWSMSDLLNGKEVVRLSVADEDREYIDATDMFETKDMNKVRRFMDLVV